MTRSILSGLLGLISVVALGSLPAACQSGGLGDPCTPEDEYNPDFAGFKVTEENIESRSFQCATRICLVNHFQGRVSCPLGQAPPQACSGPMDTSCGADTPCVEAGTLAPDCDPDAGTGCAGVKGTTCDATKRLCVCDPAGNNTPGTFPDGFTCAPEADGAKIGFLKTYVCHKSNNCQTADGTDNAGKDCCIPGTDTPVSVPVCGQCNKGSQREAEAAVYCSCRCGPPETDGNPETNDIAPDDDFNYCTCPTGFTCSEIRKDVGLGDKQITGKYCIKEGTGFKSVNDLTCEVSGFFARPQCEGVGGAAPPAQ